MAIITRQLPDPTTVPEGQHNFVSNSQVNGNTIDFQIAGGGVFNNGNTSYRVYSGQTLGYINIGGIYHLLHLMKPQAQEQFVQVPLFQLIELDPPTYSGASVTLDWGGVQQFNIRFQASHINLGNNVAVGGTVYITDSTGLANVLFQESWAQGRVSVQWDFPGSYSFTWVNDFATFNQGEQLQLWFSNDFTGDLDLNNIDLELVAPL